MSFLRPLLLVGLLSLAIPIAIHLLHRRRPIRKPFAAMELVYESLRRIERALKLKRFILLLSRCLLLGAFVVAAAGPFIQSGPAQPAAAHKPKRIAWVLDASVSMRAGQEQSAFAAATQAIARDVRAMGPSDQGMIVLAGRRPRRIGPALGESRRELLTALREITPEFGSADLAQAAAYAARKLKSDAPAVGTYVHEVRVVSDFAAGSITAPLREIPGELSILLRPVAPTPDGADGNCGITKVEARSTAAIDRHAVSFSVRIQCFGPVRARQLRLHADGETRQTVSFECADGQTARPEVTAEFEQPGAHRIEFRLDGDALAEDNVFPYSLYIAPPVTTLIVNGAPSEAEKQDETFYLQRALRAALPEQPAAKIVSTDQLSETDLSPYRALILAGLRTISPKDGTRIQTFVREGGGLFLSFAPNSNVENLNARLSGVLPKALRGHTRLGKTRADGHIRLQPPSQSHPLLAALEGDGRDGLLSTRTWGHLSLEPSARPSTAVLEFESGQAALVAHTHGRGRVVLWTSSIDRDLTDLPIQPAFVPLIRNILVYVSQAPTAETYVQAPVGRPIELTRPEGAASARLERPTDPAVPLRWPPDEGAPKTVSVTDTHAPGLYRLAFAYPDGRPVPGDHAFTVHIDPREMDLRRLPDGDLRALLAADAPGDSAADGVGRNADGQSPLWLDLLLAGCLLAFVMECWVLGQRGPKLAGARGESRTPAAQI